MLSKTSILLIHEHLFLSKLEDIGNFYEYIIHNLKVKSINVTEEFEKSDMSDEDKEFYFSDEFYIYDSIFPIIFKKDIFLSCYFLFESGLMQLFNYISINYKKPQPKTKSSGITKYKEFFSESAKIEFPENSNEWDNILKYRSIRNVLAHADGRPKRDNDIKICSEFSSKGFIEIKNNEILLNDSLMTQMFLDYSVLYKELIKQLKVKYT